MTKKHAAEKPTSPRKAPRQRRAGETVAVIVEAAARILETKGFEGFNTNAVAEKAGVSIGSLYQYFPGKNALLSAIIERESIPLLDVTKDLAEIKGCRAAVQCYIQAAIRHQMRRPHLARLIDVAERREIFGEQVIGTATRLQSVIEAILELPDSPKLNDTTIVAADVLAISKSLIDQAGERGEGESIQLMRRVEGAIWGYLTHC